MDALDQVPGKPWGWANNVSAASLPLIKGFQSHFDRAFVTAYIKLPSGRYNIYVRER